ncbi:MAG: 16S rRNA (uracil(1498)-N(3))-methyltransferase [Pseudohongiellaceae bacterium]|nr:16S rRNA (uracil(1498)-N(3))-methyltransferase [Pseudohongiellaceae bacterium]
MRISRVFADIDLQCDSLVTLKDDQAHYLGKVLRIKAGDAVSLFNSHNGEFNGTVESVEKKCINIRLHEQVENHCDPSFPIHIAIGISRGERMDYVVQKATEAGASSVTPLFSERCEVKLKGDRAQSRVAHWQKVAISACEQNGRCSIPTIHQPIDLQTWLQQHRQGALYVLDHRGSEKLSAQMAPESVYFLIGPEGGLSEDEIAAAKQYGFTSLCIGPRVLRTETAPIVAITLAQHLWGDY